MLRVHAFGVGWATLAASTAVHAIVLLAAVTPGSRAAATPAGADVPTVSLDLDPKPADDALDAPPLDVPPDAVTPPVPATPAATAARSPTSNGAPVAHATAMATTSVTNAEPVAALTAPATDAMPRFSLVVGIATDGHGAVAPATTTNGPPRADGTDEGAPIAAELASAPAERVVGPKPVYPAEARAQGVEGDVVLEIVIGRTGAVESARALRPSGYGFEEAALAAVRAYRYRPAMRDGHPVRVRMRVPMQFRFE